MIQIDVPSGLTVEIKDGTISIKGSAGTNTRKVNDKLLVVKKDGEKISIDPVKDKTLAKPAMKAEIAFAKLVKNDIEGAQKAYEIKMKIVFAHFPINVEVKGTNLHINNMIGERVPRISRIIGATKIEAKGTDVKLTGPSLDDVSQTAANIRKACKIRNKDSRTFQDGLYYAME
ncbi:MAG: 50S ribosomal protein L6 [Candidatus Micrarchaeota archaeon]|nr:50S ribosomal protein L6 [Candidatus Micrarchaeota archaeon]